ncbi:unnamed protein product, partial [Rotaria magnacalcarata]
MSSSSSSRSLSVPLS